MEEGQEREGDRSPSKEPRVLPKSVHKRGCSEGLVVPHRQLSFRGRGARGALVHALRAGALVLLFGACAGRHGGRGRRGGARLLLKVCDNDRHVPHGDSQLLGRAPVNILQLGPENVRGFVGLGCRLPRLYAVFVTGRALVTV